MKESIALKVAGVPRRIEFEMPDAPARPAELLPVFRQFSNLMVEAAEGRAVAAGEAISCTKGCGACCRQLVPIREMEARRLAEVVRAMPESRRAAILERFHDAARQLAANGMRQRLEARGGLDKAGRVTLKIDYFALGIACPFLDAESCGIYEERPMICREHLVTTPARWCAAPGQHPIRTLPMTRADSAVAKLEPDTPGWIPLVDLLEWADAHPVDEAERGDPRAMLERFVRDLIG